jgi:excisionase family DNA binding protein
LLHEEATASSVGNSNVEVFDLPLTEANGATVGKEREGRHFLTVEEVAVRLCVSRNWIYTHASELGAYRLGKYLRFSWSTVLERLRQ